MTAPTWRKSTYSGTSGDCVELAVFPSQLGVRDSKTPERGHLSLSARQTAAFLARVKSGQFDR